MREYLREASGSGDVKEVAAIPRNRNGSSGPFLEPYAGACRQNGYRIAAAATSLDVTLR
jgi:hypothetical protein